MKTAWNPADRAELENRFASLTDGRPARWGKMHCAQMIQHVTWAIQMATGERPVAPRKTPLRFFPIKQLILYVVPFPKSAPTAPSLVPHDTSTVSEERLRLKAALGSFAEKDRNSPWAPHPAFGAMSGSAWGGLVYKHADHHLRQFGA